MIDIHAHILPGVDDGARSWEESIAMLKLSYAQGFRHIIATPHHSRRRGCAGLYGLAKELQERARIHLPDISIYPGEELFYYDGLGEDLREGRALTLAESRFVLVEFGVEISYSSLYQAVRKLNMERYVPVLAHVERYVCMRENGRMEELRHLDCRFQMNYESLKGGFFDRQTRWCRKQVRSGKIHFLGTDMHRLDIRRPDTVGVVHWMERHVPENLKRAMTDTNAAEIFQSAKSSLLCRTQ